MQIKKGFIEILEEQSGFIVDEKFVLVNFPVKKAIKLFPYYQKITYKERETLAAEIQNLIEFSKEILLAFEAREIFEKCLIVTYSLLKKNHFIMISDMGLSDESIKIFKIVMKQIMKILENKSLYFVRRKNEPTYIDFNWKKM